MNWWTDQPWTTRPWPDNQPSAMPGWLADFVAETVGPV